MKERISYWDNLRFFLMLLVVVAHFIGENKWKAYGWEGFYMFLYAFHMPLFLFVSGMFFKNKNILEKFVAYFFFYFILKVLTVLIKIGYGKDISGFEVFAEDGFQWFVMALAIFTVLTSLLYETNLKAMAILFVILACFIGYDKTVGDFWVLSRVIVFYPFYLLGVVIDRRKIPELGKNRWIRIAAVLILLTGMVLFIVNEEHVIFWGRLFAARKWYEAEIRAYGWLYRLAAYGMAVLFGGAFLCIVPDRDLGFTTICGQRTVQVYFYHRLVLYLLGYSTIRRMICKGTEWGCFVWLFLAIGLTYFLSLRIFRYPTDWIMKGVYRSNRASESNG